MIVNLKRIADGENKIKKNRDVDVGNLERHASFALSVFRQKNPLTRAAFQPLLNI